MLRAWLADSANADGWSTALADPVIARALAAIHAEPARPWTVEQLAATARLTRWRMATAARLLGETDKTLHQLAAAIGNGSAFAKAFRREYASTPGDYRLASRTSVTKTATPDAVA